MQLRDDQMLALVDQVLKRVRAGDVRPRGEIPKDPRGVYKTVSDAVAAARTAQQLLIHLPLEKRREIVAN
ncbi:hypothetical protein L6R46_31190, partial [Myxococcota bacterium]|nr:hypothetical protein [Myxococcota bacterium]